jgi:hypothetical protein
MDPLLADPDQQGEAQTRGLPDPLDVRAMTAGRLAPAERLC